MKLLISTNKNIMYRYDDKLIPIIHKKDIINSTFYGINFYYNHLFRCVTQDMINYYHEMLYKLTLNHNMILYRFLKKKKKIQTRETMKRKNEAVQCFMKHIHVCNDIKNKIYSYL